MNKKAKRLIVVVVAMIMVLGTITAFAGSNAKNITAYYNSIKIVVDGSPVALGNDSQGKKIEPFIYNGVTYLPVRAVGEAIGKNVDWDAKTQTVYVGEKPGAVKYLTEEVGAYDSDRAETYNLNDTEKLMMGGTEYKTGYALTNGHGYLLFNLNGQYNTLTGYLGVIEANGHPDAIETVSLYLDGNLYKTYELVRSDMPKLITIPVTGVAQLHIEYDDTTALGYTDIGLGDFTVK